NHILEGSVIGGTQRLAGEISTLKGHKYTLKDMGGFLSDPDLWKIQLALFPNYPQVPVFLSDFRRQIQIAFDSNTGDIRDVAQDWLAICQQGESWLVRHVEEVHQRMGQAASQGYLFPYDEVDLVLLPQLGIERQDEHYKRTAQQSATANAQQQPRALTHEEYVSMKNEIIAEWRAEQAVARVQRRLCSSDNQRPQDWRRTERAPFRLVRAVPRARPSQDVGEDATRRAISPRTSQ